jgi:hydroxymethylpyrimidine pyrophosphatase-like HAD family hydrolase
MILSKQKQNYVLDRSIESIEKAYDYELDTSLYSKTFKLKYLLDIKSKGVTRQDVYKIYLYFYEKKLSKVTLYREEGNVEIEKDGHEEKFELISNLMFDRVRKIDDDKFRKIFPEYDLMEERNDILEELLGTKEELDNAKETTEEPDKQPVVVETKRKRFWIF